MLDQNERDGLTLPKSVTPRAAQKASTVMTMGWRQSGR